jgi:hypothetical protein
MYRRWRRRKKPKLGVHGRPPFPCTVDYREPEAGVKGSLGRAQLRRALDPRLGFPRKITEKRERGALGHPHSQLSYRATICQRSTGRSSLAKDCTTELLFPMCHSNCFEAGRFTQIQSSWTALCCSRKWMSGHADALAQSSTDPIWQIRANRRPSDCGLAGNPSDKSEEMCVFP